MTETSLASLVRSLRTDLGLSQDDIAERANVSRGWVSRVEQGDIKRPDPAILDRLAAALNSPAANLHAAAGYRVSSVPTTEPSVIDLLRQAQVKLERAEALGAVLGQPGVTVLFKGYELLSPEEQEQFVAALMRSRRKQDREDDRAGGDGPS